MIKSACNKKWKVGISALLILIWHLPLKETFAFSGGSNARSVGLAGAYTALARGVDAPFWNPANLGLAAPHKLSLNLISVGISIGNNSFSKSQYDLYNGAFLTDADKEAILTSIPGGGLKLNVDSEIQVLGFSYGSFALTATGKIASDLVLTKDCFELLLFGNQYGRTYYIAPSDGQGWAISSFSLSAARTFPLPYFKEFAFGLSLKYLLGFAYGEVVKVEGSGVTDIEGARGNGKVILRHALGGKGFALDWGIAATLRENWTFSLGVENMFGKISWDKKAEEFEASFFTKEGITVENANEDSLVITTDTTRTLEAFNIGMPPELRLGVARSWKNTTLVFDYVQGFASAPGVTTRPQFSWGVEYNLLGLLPLRAGISLGGINGKTSALGIGLNLKAFVFDFAIGFPGSLLPKLSKGLNLALTFKLLG